MRRLWNKLLCKMLGHILTSRLKYHPYYGGVITGIEDYCKRKGCGYSNTRNYNPDKFHPT
jgi:DNA-binding LacI/PurR family transcriptional regulator